MEEVDGMSPPSPPAPRSPLAADERVPARTRERTPVWMAGRRRSRPRSRCRPDLHLAADLGVPVDGDQAAGGGEEEEEEDGAVGGALGDKACETTARRKIPVSYTHLTLPTNREV